MKRRPWFPRILVLALFLSWTLALLGPAAAQEAGPLLPEDSPPGAVSIAGPSAGRTHTTYTLTASVSPLTATLPLTYTWEATSQEPIIRTGRLSDTAAFTWSTGGLQAITVTVRNAAGAVSAAHQLTVTSPWTMIVYLNGDNNLDRWTDDLFNKLEAAAANPNVDILVLWDRHPGGMWDDHTCLYEVQYDTNPSRLFPYTENVNRWCFGELNMGDRQTLADLVNRVKADYPAEHYFLSIFDHGGGWSPELPPLQPPPVYAWLEGGFGLSWDDTDKDYLSTYDLGWALDGAGPLDVVLHDACLMAMVENAYEVRADASFLVASENLALATLPYDRYVAAITATTTPADLAVDVAQIYMESLPPGFSGSISVLQSDKTAAVATATSGLGQALSALLPSPTAREQIASAYMDAQKVDYDSDLVLEPGQDGFVDLYSFAEQVMLHVTDTQAVVAAVRVLSALDNGFVLYEDHRDGSPYANTLAGLHGASVYLPLGEELYIGHECLSKTLDICATQLDPACIQLRHFYTTTVPPQDRQLRFAQDTAWDEFVNGFISEYYGCGGKSAAWPAGVLPPERPIHVLHQAAQRPEPIRPYSIYLPLVVAGKR